MARIEFRKFATLEVSENSNLMKSLLEASIPVASSCGGDGICRKCKVKVLEGLSNLSSPTQLEKSWIEKDQMQGNERLSCQALVLGNIKVDTDYW